MNHKAVVIAAVVALAGCGGDDDGGGGGSGGGDGGEEPTAAEIRPCLSDEHDLFVTEYEIAGDETGNLEVKPGPDDLAAVISVVSFNSSTSKDGWVEFAPNRNSSALSLGDKVAVAWSGSPLPTPEQQSVIDAVSDCLGS